MADIASAIGGLLTCLCTPNCINTLAVEQCKFVINPTKRLKELLKQKAILIAHKEDVISRLDKAEVGSGIRRSNVVIDWLKNVDQFLNETNGIEEVAKKRRRDLICLLPNCCSHSRMGSDISMLLREATKLLEKAVGLSADALAITEIVRGTEFPVGRIFGETTAHETMEQVWGCLMNNETGTIGVCGMGGVGKTTIVTEINNRLLRERHLFDTVIWVTVSQSTSIHQIQVKIASALSLPLPVGEDEREISASLFRALKQRKKVVLILDDIWEKVSLLDIGIPEPTKDNGCKILLTTRKLEVCQKMGCSEVSTFKVNPLSEEEAWELFMDKIGVELSEEVKKIAKDVLKGCAGLPLAIVTVGGSMRGNEQKNDWNIALNDLKDSRKYIINMETEVFNCLRFSYERLPNEKFKKCFLYCALYPEDYEINPEKLINYWIMSGLIEGKDSQDEIDQGQFILDTLGYHCLLESVKESYKRVQVHDLIRDMALQSTTLLVKAGVFLKELPNETEWSEDLESASFMDNEIEEISISPRCPKLSILLLYYNNKLHSISDRFFVQMQGLRVLDLSHNWNIEFLPDSISDLVNLHALLLRTCSKLKSLPSFSKLQLLRILDLSGCHALQSLPDAISVMMKLQALRLGQCFKIMWVPSVAKLQSLRTLELDETGIKELPPGINMLVNLTSLNLEGTYFTFKETTPPRSLLSALTSLQCLNLDGIDLKNLYPLGSGGELVKDLLGLKDLKSLSIKFPSLSDWANFVGSSKYKGLEDFCIVIGHGCTSIFEDRNRSFRVYDPEGIPYDANFLPRNTEYFHFSRFKDMRDLTDLRCLKDVRQLKGCSVEECETLEYIAKYEEEEEDEDEFTMVQSVEELHIQYCRKLQSVYNGIPNTIYLLRKLDICGCHSLKSVFSSPRLLQQLQNLETIIIRKCDQLEEVIKVPPPKAETIHEETREATNTIITLPKFKFMWIMDLPKLKNIWKGEMVCDSLQTIEVHSCHELKSIPTLVGVKQSPPPLLTEIKGSKEWWDSVEWDHPFTKSLFEPFFSEEGPLDSSASSERGSFCDF